MIRHGPHVRRHEPIRLHRWHEWTVYATTGLMLISGILWLMFHYGVYVDTEFGPRPHPLEYQWLRLHGAAAMLGLIALGSMLPVHVRRAWESRKNRMTGLLMAGLFAMLTISGYALYYLVSESSRPWISALHWGLGLALPLLLFWHIRVGQARRRAQTQIETLTTTADAIAS